MEAYGRAMIFAAAVFLFVRIIMLILKRLNALSVKEPKNETDSDRCPQIIHARRRTGRKTIPTLVRFSRGRPNETHCYCHIIYTLSEGSEEEESNLPSTSNASSTERSRDVSRNYTQEEMEPTDSQVSSPLSTAIRSKRRAKGESPPPPYHAVVNDIPAETLANNQPSKTAPTVLTLEE